MTTWFLGAFTVKGVEAVVKCSVILYHVYFERQVCVFYLFKITISFWNYISLLMILILHKFKVISLSFESPFMHIKHLKCNCQIMLLDLNILFVYQMCTIHSQILKGDSYWWFKVKKELRIIKKIFVTNIYTFGSNVLLAL
jgi:hypothetical protein